MLSLEFLLVFFLPYITGCAKRKTLKRIQGHCSIELILMCDYYSQSSSEVIIISRFPIEQKTKSNY